MCQSEVDALEQKQKESNQISLLSSQIHVLLQAVGDLQKDFAALGKDMNHKIHELEADMASSQDNVQEMKFAWAEANGALSKMVHDGLADLAAEHANALEEHAVTHSAKLTEMQELHDTRHATHEAALKKGIEDVQSIMQQELAARLSNNEGNRKQSVKDVGSQINEIRAELASSQFEVQEMKFAWVEANGALSKTVHDGFAKLAAEQTKALEEHTLTHSDKLTVIQELHDKRHAKHELVLQQGIEYVKGTMQQEFAALLSSHEVNLTQVVKDLTGQIDEIRADLVASQDNAQEMKLAWAKANGDMSKTVHDGFAKLAAEHTKALEEHALKHDAKLTEIQELHDSRHATHEVALQQGIEVVQSTMQQELEPLLSSHELRVMQVVKDVRSQIIEIRAELASSQDNVQEMKLAWVDVNGDLSKAVHDDFVKLAAEHTKALDGHSAAYSAKLTEIQELHDTRHAKHEAALQQGIEEIHSTVQHELAALRSTRDVNLVQVVNDLTSQIVELEASMEQMAKDVAAAQEADTELHLEFVKHSKEAKEMKAGWLDALSALSKSTNDRFGDSAADHAQALGEHASHALTVEQQQQQSSTHEAKFAEMETLHNKRCTQQETALQQGLKEVRNMIQQELAKLRLSHEVDLMEVAQDVTSQVGKLNTSIDQIAKDVAKHSCDAKEMKADWVVAHSAMSKTINDGLSKLSAEHAKALEEHAALALMIEQQQTSTQGAKVAEMEELPKEEAPKEEAPKEEPPKEEAPKEEPPKEEPPKEEPPKEEPPKEEPRKEELPNKRYLHPDVAPLQGLKEVRSTLKQELAELRLGPYTSVTQLMENATSPTYSAISPTKQLPTSLTQIAKERLKKLR